MPITLKGTPVEVGGKLPAIGKVAPDFRLVGSNLQDVGLSRFAGLRKILNIFPSVDTPTCAESVRKFNEKASSLPNTVVLCISADLPFAQQRFCAAEGLKDVVMLSTFRSRRFHNDYGVELIDGPLAGLTARAIIILDGQNKVLKAELVPEIVNEPDYSVMDDLPPLEG